MGIWLEAVRDIGFPAAVALILLWAGRSLVDKVTNDLGHDIKGLGQDIKEMKGAMIALLEHFRNGAPPGNMVGKRGRKRGRTNTPGE
jgi:hypothetical protein